MEGKARQIKDSGGEMEENVLCFICCFSFKRVDGGDDSSKEVNDKSVLSEDKKDVNDPAGCSQFKLFCEELQSQKDGGKPKFIATSLLTLLKFPPCKQRLSVCLECLELVKKAIVKKVLMEEVERKVRNLQVELLKELRTLRGRSHEYLDSMETISKTVKNSDGNCLQLSIDKEKIRGTKAWMKRDIGLFRESVVEVSGQLSQYKNKLEEYESISLQSPKEESPSSSTIGCTVPPSLEYSDSSKFPSKRKPILLPASTSTFQNEDEAGEDEDFGIDSPAHSPSPEPVFYEFYNEDDDDLVKKESKTDDVGSASDTQDGVDDDDEDYDPESDKASSSLCFNHSQKRKRCSSTSSGKKRTKSISGNPKVLRYLGAVKPQDLEGMSPFKKGMVSRALHRVEYNNKRIENEVTLEAKYEPLKYFYLRYVPPVKEEKVSDKFMVGNVEIFINEEKKSLTCSLCSYTVVSGTIGKRQRMVERTFQQHVARIHMKMLSCPVEGCGKTGMNGLAEFRKHILNHKHPSLGVEVENPKPTSFKERVIERAVNRQGVKDKQALGRAKAKEEGKEDVEELYNPKTFFYIKYIQNKLMVGDEVEIFINEEEKSLNCSLCPFTPTSSFPDPVKIEKSIFTHILRTHMEKFPCPVEGCGERVKSEWLFRQHLRAHKGLAPLECTICGKPGTTAEGLRYHFWSHKNEQDVAEALARGEVDPRKHFRDKRSGQLFRCKKCGKNYGSRFVLTSHMKSGCGDDRERIVCPKCGKEMLKRSYDIYHKRFSCTDEEVKFPFKCPYCEGKAFSRRSILAYHLRRAHPGSDKPHQEGENIGQCEVCGKGFQTKERLKMHMNIHNRSFKCSKDCGMNFCEKKRWRMHEQKCQGRGTRKVRRWKNGYGSWSKGVLKAELNEEEFEDC